VSGARSPASILTAATDLRERLRVNGTRVLALDDDPVFLAALRAVLEQAGLTVSTSDASAGFWEQLERARPDLVVLDNDMPEASGAEICRALRNDPRWAGIPVVFLTANVGPAPVRAMFEAGADDYLGKPLIGPEVLSRIANRLERTRLHATVAETDRLTGLIHRVKAPDAIALLLAMADRYDQPATLAILDVDRFRSINERHGRTAGDVVLRELTALLREHFRSEDSLARWGDDEFLVGMYGMTSADARQRLGEFVEVIRAHQFHEGRIGITLSAGVAEYRHQGTGVDDLERAAAAALVTAKREGRDRVAAADRADGEGPRMADVALVEDDAVLGQLLEHALQTRGYRTRWIQDGAAATAELAGVDPELVAPVLLLDWDLPGLDGLRVLQTLRKRGVLERTRVIMLTARGTETEILESLGAGAVDHVTKPFSIPVLLQRVRRAMER
jgi:diguanylate cyclase (GGDEF)-like protein